VAAEMAAELLDAHRVHLPQFFPDE
jgi:hypothetical protein